MQYHPLPGNDDEGDGLGEAEGDALGEAEGLALGEAEGEAEGDGLGLGDGQQQSSAMTMPAPLARMPSMASVVGWRILKAEAISHLLTRASNWKTTHNASAKTRYWCHLFMFLPFHYAGFPSQSTAAFQLTTPAAE
jgi:hypothetical protein